MNLATAYRVVGILVLAAAVLELFAFDDLQIPAFVIGANLALVSFLVPSFPKSFAIAGLVLAVLVPFAAFLRWQEGLVMGFIPVFDLLVFGALGFSALRTFRLSAVEGQEAEG